MRFTVWLVAFVTITAPVLAAASNYQAAATTETTKVVSLSLQPSGLVLEHARDLRRIVVLGVTESGTMVDLTDSAQFAPDSGVVRRTTDGYFEPVQEEYRRRRDVVLDALGRMPGVFARVPEGAFYVMARLPVSDSSRFAAWLLTDHQHEGETVMVAPGDGFYATPGLGRDEIRIAYVLDRAALARAMDCLAAGLRAHADHEA